VEQTQINSVGKISLQKEKRKKGEGNVERYLKKKKQGDPHALTVERHCVKQKGSSRREG